MADKFRKELSLGLAALALLVSLTLGLPLLLNAQLDTRDLISNPGFWPTQTKYPINDYAGPQACAQCHGQIATQQRSTSMAQTAMRASNSPLLAANPLLRFRAGVYDYEIRTTGGHSTYTVWDGKRSESKPLVWAFGTDRIAQSFLFKKDDGAYYEARVTHFRSLGELDFTPGRALTHAADMNEAMDREVGAAEIGRCFGCHTTGAGAGASFDGQVDPRRHLRSLSRPRPGARRGDERCAARRCRRSPRPKHPGSDLQPQDPDAGAIGRLLRILPRILLGHNPERQQRTRQCALSTLPP
jgi:mono/diheme cytochrome c family protein